MFTKWLAESIDCEMCDTLKEEIGRILCRKCWEQMKIVYPDSFRMYMRECVEAKGSLGNDYMKLIIKISLKRKLKNGRKTA